MNSTKFSVPLHENIFPFTFHSEFAAFHLVVLHMISLHVRTFFFAARDSKRILRDAANLRSLCGNEETRRVTSNRENIKPVRGRRKFSTTRVTSRKIGPIRCNGKWKVSTHARVRYKIITIRIDLSG